MQRYAHLDVNLARTKYYNFNLHDLENDLKIQNPAWHPPTPFSVYYELLI